MLLLISGSLEAQSVKYEKLKLKIPTLYLDNFDYKISLRYIYMHGVNDIPEQILFLSTNAVDKSPFNLEQEIYTFQSNGSNYIFAETKTIREYKIQMKEFHTSEFYLHFPIPLQEKIIVKILLEIKRDDRIQ